MRRRKCLADKELERAIECPPVVIYERPISLNTSSVVDHHRKHQQQHHHQVRSTKSSNQASETTEESNNPNTNNNHITDTNNSAALRNYKLIFDFYSAIFASPQPTPAATPTPSLFDKLNLFKSYYNQIAANLQEAYAQTWLESLNRGGISSSTITQDSSAFLTPSSALTTPLSAATSLLATPIKTPTLPSPNSSSSSNETSSTTNQKTSNKASKFSVEALLGVVK